MKQINRLWIWLLHAMSRKPVYTFGTFLICAALLVVPWLFKAYPFQNHTALASTTNQLSLQAGEPTMELPAYLSGTLSNGVTRLAHLHTEKPDLSKFEVTQYTVQKGDTIFDIADKFRIKPSTILWGNLTRLADNPEMIYPGQVLNILPVDGVYYEWQKDDGLNGVAKGLGVKPEDIISYPGNHLDERTIGSLSHPNIKPGTWIIVPGGHRNFITWSAPTISRFSPGVAKLYGAGACTEPSDGAVGSGTFTYPTVEHWLSGYDYTPDANHSAVDFAGSMGNAIYAADNGVVVYSGWNDRGYGNVIVIDHGNGYQTLYGHLSVIKAGCGLSVNKGQLIGLMGSTGHSTGPHLHFEMWYNSTHVNPHDYLAIGK